MARGVDSDIVATPATSKTRLQTCDLTIRAGTRTLLRRANVEFRPGGVSLIVGCSGAGKSLFLRALAGLIRSSDGAVHVDGECRFQRGDHEIPTSERRIGFVFQHFALFDELTPLDNVRLAQSHQPGPRRAAGTARQLLDQLSVPTHVRTSALSEGQQQRLAIARTLAQRPDVILYDEPTSGLDAATARVVAQTIHATHVSCQVTSIIVTHDYEILPQIADDVYLFDAATQSLRLLSDEECRQLPEMMKPYVPDDGPLPIRAAGFARQVVDRIGDGFEITTRAAVATACAPFHMLPLWTSYYWGLRYFVHYLNLVAGPSAWVYIAIAGMIFGFVTTYFTFQFLPYRSYTEPLLIENLLTSLGFLLYRIFVPVLGSILIAARSGAAVASDIGGKSYGQQIDALSTIGVNPKRYLLTGSLWAFLVGTPVLLAIAWTVAGLTSLVVFTATHPALGPMFWDAHFFRTLRASGGLLFDGSGWLLAKTLISAAGIALISYYRSAGPKRSGRDVSTAITSSILWSTLLVLVVQFAFSFFEFERADVGN